MTVGDARVRGDGMGRSLLIALSGRKRSGKTTAGEVLESVGFRQIAFAEPAKRMLLGINPYVDGTRSGLPADEARALSWNVRHALHEHVGLSVTREQAAQVVSIIDPLSRGTTRVHDLLAGVDFDWDQVKDEAHDPLHRELRRLQQRSATEAVHGLFGDNVWADLAMRRAATLRSAGRSVAVTDCRFPNEAAAVRAQGGFVVRIVRPDLSPLDDSHSSEVGLPDHLVDAEIINDSTLDVLGNRVAVCVGQFWADQQAARQR